MALCVQFKERVDAEHNLMLRFRGLLNTVTGGVDYHAVLRKCITVGSENKRGGGCVGWVVWDGMGGGSMVLSQHHYFSCRPLPSCSSAAVVVTV